MMQDWPKSIFLQGFTEFSDTDSHLAQEENESISCKPPAKARSENHVSKFINLDFTWAGNLDSPLHFLSSQAEGSMLEPPKLAACKEQF